MLVLHFDGDAPHLGVLERHPGARSFLFQEDARLGIDLVEVEVHLEPAVLTALGDDPAVRQTDTARQLLDAPGDTGVEVDGQLDENLLANVHTFDVLAGVIVELLAEPLGGGQHAGIPA